MSEANEGLPEAAKPRVFHHEGKRLFIINGEPRVADEDLAKDLEMVRTRNIRTNLIDPNRDGLLMLGSIIQIDPQARQLIHHDPAGVSQPLFEKAVAECLLELLKTEGLIDPSKRGEKPKINFLNAEQAKFLIVTSATPKGRQLLVELIKLEKAWRDGTLEPARPTIEEKTPELKLLELIASGAKAPVDVPRPRRPSSAPLTLDDEFEIDGIAARLNARYGVFEQVPFLVDETRSIRIRYSELARLLDCEAREIYSIARLQAGWLKGIAPLHQRRESGGGWMTYHDEGGVHTATYFTLGQAIAIAVSRGHSDLESEIVDAFALFDRILTDYADEHVAWRQNRDEDDAKMERAPTLLRASLEQLRASLEGVALLREVSAKLDGLAGSAPQPAASRGWRFWRRG